MTGEEKQQVIDRQCQNGTEENPKKQLFPVLHMAKGLLRPEQKGSHIKDPVFQRKSTQDLPRGVGWNLYREGKRSPQQGPVGQLSLISDGITLNRLIPLDQVHIEKINQR